MGSAAKHTQVLIVGAGPTGLTLAIALRLQGVDAVVIDRQEQGANTSRAAVIHACTLSMLEPLGVSPSLVKRGVLVPLFRVRDRDRILLGIDFGTLPGNYPFTLMLPQDQTEAILLERLRELGGRVQWSTELRNVERHNGDLVATVSAQSCLSDLAATWIVGCDGFHSRVRELAGIDFLGDMYEQSFVLADVTMDRQLPRTVVDLYLASTGLMVVAPLPEGRYRIVATLANAPEEPDASAIQQILDERGAAHETARIDRIIWSSRFHVHRRLATYPLAGTFILCGDAAHVHSPAGGQGMNLGIRDAVSLAGPLKRALANDRGPLDAWAARRHHAAKAVVGMTDRMTRAATLRSLPAKILRNATLGVLGSIPTVRKAVARRIAGMNE